MNWVALSERIAKQFVPGVFSIHGPDHWRRVERNALAIARENGADEFVVRLFSLFHDSRRLNDGGDLQHGPRGAELAIAWHGDAFQATAEQLRLLVEACRGHTTGLHHADPTIGACWDADRLDLGRVGKTPDAHFMSTEAGREMALKGPSFYRSFHNDVH